MTVVTPQLRSSAVILFSGNIVENLVAFGAQVVIARHLFPEDFGRFAITLANTSLVFVFVSMHMTALILRRPAAEMTAELRQRYFFAFTAESVVGAALALGIVHLFNGLTILDVTLIAALALGHWVDTSRAFYERLMSYRKIVSVEVGSKLAGHAVAVAMILMGAGVIILYVREFVVVVLRLIGSHINGSLTIERLRWLPWREWRLLISESRALWADGILEGSFHRIVILLSGALGGAHGAGLFFFAHRLALVPQQLLMPIAGRLSANWLSREEDRAVRRENFSRLIGVLLVLTGIMALAAVIFADPLIPWIFGDRWQGAVPVFMALAGMIMFSVLFELIKAYCYVERAGRTLLASRASQFVVLGVVATVLYLFGIDPAEGMAFGMSAAFAVACGIAWIMLGNRAGPEGEA